MYTQCVVQHRSVDQYISVGTSVTRCRASYGVRMLHARAACACTDTKLSTEACQTFIPLFIPVQLRVKAPDGCRFLPFKLSRRFRCASRSYEKFAGFPTEDSFEIKQRRISQDPSIVKYFFDVIFNNFTLFNKKCLKTIQQKRAGLRNMEDVLDN